MKRYLLALLVIGLVAPVVAQNEAPKVIASVAKGSKTGIGNLQLLHTSKGELIFLYSEGSKVFVMASKDKGAAWTDLAGKPGASVLSEEARGGFDVCIDGDDVVHLAIASRFAIKVQTLKCTGKTWSASEAKTLDKGLGLRGPTICKDTSGDVWVGYYFGGRDGKCGIRASRTPSGERFGENTGRFNVNYGFGSTVQKLVVWRGRPVLFYSGATNHESRQIYWTAFDAKRWPRPAVGVGECSRAPGLFSVVADDQDVVHVAWRKFGAGENGIYYKRYDASGKWSDVKFKVLNIDRGGRSSGPVLSTDGVRTWCLWSHPGKGELAYRVLKNGAWSAEPRVVSVEQLGWSLTSPARMPADANAIPIVFPRVTTTPKVPAREVLFTPIDLGAGK